MWTAMFMYEGFLYGISCVNLFQKYDNNLRMISTNAV